MILLHAKFKENVLDNLDNINKKTLEYFLVTPDVATAKASFIAYYLNAMNKKGVKTSEVDFTKPLDKEAAQFAQQQVLTLMASTSQTTKSVPTDQMMIWC